MKWSRSNIIAVVLVALIGGIITSLFGVLAWSDWVALQNQRRVIANGVEAHAEFKGTRYVRTRGDTRYLVNATWKDHQGASRTMDGVNVTKAFFQEVEAGRGSASLKYLPAEPKAQPVLVEDAAALDNDLISRIQGRFVALLVGFAAGGLGLWGWRRRTSAAVIGLLAFALGAPAAAQLIDPAPKDSAAPRLRSKGCPMSIQYIVRDGTRHRCWYSYNQKLEICVLNCDPPMQPTR